MLFRAEEFLQDFFGVKDFIIKFASAIRWIDASLAQLVEHDTLNVGVQGSSP